jgi:hypothetical protein
MHALERTEQIETHGGLLASSLAGHFRKAAALMRHKAREADKPSETGNQTTRKKENSHKSSRSAEKADELTPASKTTLGPAHG